YDRFESGVLMDELSAVVGFIDYTGYHTVDLTTPVNLVKGDKFYIYVELSVGGHPYDATSEVPVLLEGDLLGGGILVESYSTTGQSFYHNGTSWEDLYFFDNTANFNIKGLVSHLSIMDPMEGDYVGGSKLVTGGASNAIDEVWVKIDNDPWQNATDTTSWSYSWDTTSYSDGPHMITARGFNGTYFIERSVNVIVDNIDPVVSITAPMNGQYFNVADVMVLWTGSDALSGLDYYEIQIDGGLWTDVGLNVFHTFLALSDGLHTAVVRVYDRAGNEDTDSVLFNIDTTNPIVTITSPSIGYVTNVADMLVEWTGSDDNSGVDHYSIQIDGGLWTDKGILTNHMFPSLSDGVHTVQVKVYDAVFNENTTNVWFNIDTVAPTITITSPSEGLVTGVPDMAVEWTGSDDNSGINHYEIMIDEGLWTNVGLSTDHSYNALSDGAHTV
ncbi:MAG: hypothetical protein KAI64_06845, partial [Thermoplasmata archaeon]|nr:hypothetical protein [Thermoplasmata archaeon]